MALPKLLSPSFWVDKCLTLALQLTLALLLQTLYVLKGEDVSLTDVKVTVRKSISSDGSRSKTNSPLKSTKQTTSKQDNTTVTATKATSNSQGDSTRSPKVPSVTSKESKKTKEKAIVTGTLTELKPDNLEKQILLEENNVATPIENEAVTPIENEVVTPIENEVVKLNDDESPKTISFEKIIEEIKEESVNAEEIKEESATVEEIEESVTVEEIEEESVIVEEIKEESVIVEEIKEESATVEEIKEESATVEEIKEESATVEEIQESVTVEEIKEESVIVEEIKEESATVEEINEKSVAVEDTSILNAEVVEEINEKSDLQTHAEVVEEINEKSDLQTQLAPLQLKTSHEFTHSIDPTTDFVEFHWKHGGGKIAYVTGDFDGWDVTIKMDKDPVTGHFTAKVPIDVTKQYQFKFVVDGVWLINHDWPTTRDEQDNENNIIYPSRLSPLHPEYKEYAMSQFNLTAAAY